MTLASILSILAPAWWGQMPLLIEQCGTGALQELRGARIVLARASVVSWSPTGSSPPCTPSMPSLPNRIAEMLEQGVAALSVWASLTKSWVITGIPSYMTTCLPKALTVVSSRLPDVRRELSFRTQPRLLRASVDARRLDQELLDPMTELPKYGTSTHCCPHAYQNGRF